MSNKINITASQETLGFRHNNKQFQCNLQISLPSPQSFSTDVARRLLNLTFEIQPTRLVFHNKIYAKKTNQNLKSHLSTGISIAQHILEFGSYPSFDTPIIMGISNNNLPTERTTINISVATQTFQNHQIISYSYLMGFQLAAACALTANQRLKTIEKINENIIDLLKYMKQHTQGGYSSRFILREAFTRGLPILHRPGGHYQVGLGAKQKVFLRSAALQDSAIGARLVKDKYVCTQNLEAAGIPTPISYRTKSIAEATIIAKKIGFPVVLKPTSLERGEGVFVDLKSDEEVTSAFCKIQEISKNIMIENHVSGLGYRLLVFRNEVIFSYARHPLSVIGDGSSNIATLIEKEANKQRHLAAHLKTMSPQLDSAAMAALQSQDLTPSTVLQKGQVGHLRRFQSETRNGFDEIVTDSVHPENRELACRAARLFGLEIAGVDFISKDISIPWYENGAVINEVNFQPQIGANTAREILKGYFPNNDDSIIPIECFIGDAAALKAALERLQQAKNNLHPAYLTSHALTIDQNLSEIKLHGMRDLFSRVEYLLREVQVERLIVVVQTVEFATTGLPFYHISDLRISNNNLTFERSVEKSADTSQINEVVSLLRAAHERWRVSRTASI